MKKDHFILFLFVILSSLLSFSLMTRGHLWWDDFASYIMQAQSILQGNMAEFIRRNTISIEQSSAPVGPIAYPWGFPLLLVPLYAIFGINLLVFKLVNILFYALFLPLFYSFLRNRLPVSSSLTIIALLAFSPPILDRFDIIQSDIPFLFFSTLGLILLDQLYKDEEHSRRFKITLGLVMFAAYFLRTNGVLLIVSLLALDVLKGWPRKRAILARIRLNAAVYITFFACAVAEKLIFPGGQGSYFSHFSMFSVERLLDNIAFYLTLPANFFDLFTPIEVLTPAEYVIAFVAAFLGIYGIWRRFWDETPILLYALLTFSMFILWPERQGLRFIYPIVPFLLYFAFAGGYQMAESLNPLAENMLLGVWIGLAAVSFGTSLTLGGLLTGVRPSINGPFDPVSAQMFEYIREETPPDSLIVFFKPRVMRLMTDRDAIMLRECERLGMGDYVVIRDNNGENDQVDPDRIKKCGKDFPLTKVYGNKRFTVYKVGP
jgi:hypothetical protein